MRRGLTFTAFACGVVAAGTAEAKKASLTLPELVEASALVVVAKVESVTVAEHEKTYDFGLKAHPRTATARVMETWLGDTLPSVKFSATKTWACDESDAEPGETVVLFLGEPDEDGVRRIVNSGQGRLPASSHDLRALQKAVQDGTVPPWWDPPPPPRAPPNWLAPTGWPVFGSALLIADVALAALLWRLARRRRLGAAVRWSAFVVGSVAGSWLSRQEVQLLFVPTSPANEPEIAMIHLIWPITALVSGLLAWVAAEIAAGRSQRPFLGALGSCLGSAAVLGWFIIDPPSSLVRAFAGFQPLGVDVPQAVLVALASAIGHEALRGTRSFITGASPRS